MKSSGGGKILRVIIGLTLWGLLTAASPLNAEDIRRLWLLETLAQPPEPTAINRYRHQLGATAIQGPEQMATAASLTADLYAVELKALGGQRSYDPSTSNEHTHIGFELARFYSSPRGTHGRLGIAYLTFLPGQTEFLALNLSTGVMASAQVPWDMRVGAGYFGGSKGMDYLVLATEASRLWSLGHLGTLWLGGMFRSGQRLAGPEFGEQMLFSLGPQVRWDSPVGRWVLGIPLRLWIDTGVLDGHKTNLSEVAAPSWSLSWHGLW